MSEDTNKAPENPKPAAPALPPACVNGRNVAVDKRYPAQAPKGS